MSATGVWVVGTLTDEQVRELLLAAVRSSPSPPPPSAPTGVTAELAWWRGLGGESLFTERAAGEGGWVATEGAFRLYRFLDGCQDDSDAVEELRDAVMEQFPAQEGEGLFAAAARKANPFWALAYALGADAALLLPGWFGDFLLTSAQVRACLPRAEEALALTGARRREVIERVHAWLDGLGDDPAHDADALLDGPLRVLRHAARTGRGRPAGTEGRMARLLALKCRHAGSVAECRRGSRAVAREPPQGALRISRTWNGPSSSCR
ncbi:hypothetical protein PUR71_09890 [Streptomyces sp. SP17BM10]|uniref:hypothetical protein n=1 Tax=Streptomyces sp. SP17BM10 TaxID=3002530 RepID=UPI002E75AD82|nr:hypothetical protein [Streptomyces sp. SP17BM10]MEE1783224.1 hypothetical protein [Streptomyces sp. SP17BM10]